MGLLGRHRRLADGDLAETSFRIKLAVPIWLLLVLVGSLLQRTGGMSRGGYLILTWVVGPILALLLAAAVSWLLGALARGLLGSVIAQGGDAVRPGHSEQDALVAAGRIPDAIASFRSRLVAFPDDVEARIRLAALLAQHGAPAEARRQFATARARAAGTAERRRISSGLADLHRATGDREALRDELARCAREFPGTPAGEHARRELRDLVADEAGRRRGDPAPGGSAR